MTNKNKYIYLTDYEIALKKVMLKRYQINDSETLPLTKLLGRYLSEDIYSKINIPPMNNSAVDGFTFKIKTNEKNIGSELKIVGTLNAGDISSINMNYDECLKIMTGANVPKQCNTVVMIEDVNCDYVNNTIVLRKPILKGLNIRKKGEDVKINKKILKNGTKIRAQEIGMLASLGINKVRVLRKIKIGIMSSGNELIEPGRKKTNYQIYDINKSMIREMLDKKIIECEDLGIVKDIESRVLGKLKKASEIFDMVIITGGMSLGEKDYVTNAIKKLGKINFWRVAIKPGRPIGFGEINNRPILGLPGNPVAAFVTFFLFVRPLIKYILSDKQKTLKIEKVYSNFNFNKKPGRKEYLRGKIKIKEGKKYVDKYKYQGAGRLSSLVWAEGLIELDKEVTSIKKNDLLNFLNFNDIFS